MSKQKRIAKVIVGLLGCFILLFAVSCSSDDNNDNNNNNNNSDGGTTETLKVAWLYIGPPGDLGWTYAHHQGLLEVKNSMSNIETKYVENVTKENAAAEIEKVIDEGYKLIFTTTFDHGEATIEEAKKHPDVYFEHCSGANTANNVATYFGRMYQARYLTGILAGKMTTSKKIGIPAAMQLPEVVRHVNAIALGARSVDPEITVHVEWVNQWYDPVKSKELTEKLIAAGCDVIMQDTDDTAALLSAKDAGKWAIGYNSDVSKFAQEAVLTSAVWNWGSYYKKRIEAVMNKTWKSEAYWGPMKDGIVSLSNYHSQVTQDAKDAVEAKKNEILDGSWDVFWGPFNKKDGTEWKKAGEKMTDTEMLSMMQFVEGVEGTIDQQ